MKMVLPLIAVAAFALATGVQAQPEPGAAAPPADIESLLRATDEPAAPAEAASPEPPAAEAPPPVPTLKIPPPDMTVGVKRRYRIANTAEVARGGQTQRRSNEQVVEIEVVQASPKRIVRYVIVDGSAKDDPTGDALLNASKGVATDYEAEASGKPVRLTEWDKVRATILERLLLDPTAPLDGAKRTRTVLTAMDGTAAVAFAVPEMAMMADMQGWPELPFATAQEEARTARFGEHEARLVSRREALAPPAEQTCVAQLKAATDLDPASPAAKNLAAALKIQTDAEVSTVDGWVVRMKQVQTRLSGPQKEVKTSTIVREDPPACPAPG